MIDAPDSNEAPAGRLVENIMHFARVLRAAGLPIGPGRVIDAVRAVCAVGVADRRDFYWTLHAVFVNRADQRAIFDQAFHVFWKNPRLLERMMALALPELAGMTAERGELLNRRVSEALFPGQGAQLSPRQEPPDEEFDATFTWSDREVLMKKDFEQMSAYELAEARSALERLVLPYMQVPTRRFEIHPHGPRVDMRASLRSALRTGPGSMPLIRRRRRKRPPPLVIVCDISGSMSRYSRMLLHFAHVLTRHREHVSSFVFGTRLSNITRQLRTRDVDEAMARVTGAVDDWSGGTRIGACLREFNRFWSRRVLAQGAVVLLISDGLDRDTGAGLAGEAERLQKSCRRLIWLNPLLRYADFAPRALGMRALLPYVDDFRAAHNLESLLDLAGCLSAPRPRKAA